jgi:hypothetical protein
VGDGGERIPWDAIEVAGAARLPFDTHEGIGWLVLAYQRDGGKVFLTRPLPVGDAGDAMIKALRARLGARWLGSETSPEVLRARLGAPPTSTLRIVVTVLAVLGLVAIGGLAVAIVVGNDVSISLLLIGLGATLFRGGLRDVGHRFTIQGTPTAKAASAAIGHAELSGRVACERPTLAAVTGRPCAYWRVEVARYRPSGDDQGWHTIASRDSRGFAPFALEDESGRIPVWAEGADLLLQADEWESGSETPALPATAHGLLADLRQDWPPTSEAARIRIRESRLEQGAPLYVLGTLEERGRVAMPEPRPAAPPTTPFGLLRSGAWRDPGVLARSRLLGRAHPTTRMIVIGTARLLFGRREQAGADGATCHAPAPDVPAETVIVWAGREGRPFLVSNTPEGGALSQLRSRVRARLLGGGAIMCLALWRLLDLLAG